MVRVIVVIAIAFGAGIAVADDSVPAGFDHNLHERDYNLAGNDQPIPCARCHTMQNGLLAGRPDHASCFGACHGPAPAKGVRKQKIAIAESQARVCTNCHAPSALAKPFDGKLPVAYPPYAPTDFALAANHKSHSGVACSSCHVAAKTAPHRRCLTCHDGSGGIWKASAMTNCQPCHTPGSGTPQPPRLAEPVNTVTATFSHPKHAARGGKGANCLTCHAEILETNDNILPRTKATSCAIAGCHDGAPVFAITASCTRCHTTAPSKYDQALRDVRFSHATHKDTGLPCTSCHPISAGTEVVTAGHGPCVTCHAEDFTKREPQYCSACHNSTEPWRKLIADRAPASRTEFGAKLDHSRDAHKRDCKTCHSLTTAGSQLRPPRGHRACTNSGCHAETTGPDPKLVACEGCHQLSLATTRAVQRVGAPWSVRSTFQHATHTRAKDGGELSCIACHVDLGSNVAAMPTPTKSACVPCHDGATAFKLTGTGCTRCHPAPPPPR
ncbi:MAG: cytochrome c3 family protein [Kofleriaceae bacterium]